MAFEAIDRSKILSKDVLELTDSEINSLVAVRDMFVKYHELSKLIKFDGNDDIVGYQFNGFGAFNMGYGCYKVEENCNIDNKAYDCKTKACIAGWMKLHEYGFVKEGFTVEVTPEMADTIDGFVMNFDFNGEDSPAYSLFFPHDTAGESSGSPWDHITMEHAIYAIDSFLYTGVADWSAALAAAPSSNKLHYYA